MGRSGEASGKKMGCCESSNRRKIDEALSPLMGSVCPIMYIHSIVISPLNRVHLNSLNEETQIFDAL